MSLRSKHGFTTKTYSREDAKTLNENLLIFHYLTRDNDRPGRTMVDVGAHFGGSMMRFLRSGWDVWAFEPDPNNRTRLFERLRDEQAMPRRIDHRAVSNTSGIELEFYRSPVSAGISSLSKFHPTHEVALKVKTVSLTDFVRDFGVNDVDYLKIDVEGHDLFVLEGFPFDRLRPQAVLCEYEDHKTVPLGHTSKTLADFLANKGYHVYFSQWHPIIEYGTSHDWSLLRSYDGVAAPEESWGNLVAFADKPSPKLMESLVEKSLKTHAPSVGQPQAADRGGRAQAHVEIPSTPVGDRSELERVIENLHALTGVVEGHAKILQRLESTVGEVER